MSEFKGTPGPWVGMDEHGQYNPDHAYSLDSDDYRSIESAPIFAGKEVIALVIHGTNEFYQGSHPSIDANARLIAAAPELLSAVQFILRGIESGNIKAGAYMDFDDLDAEQIELKHPADLLRSVIAKALGEQP